MRHKDAGGKEMIVKRTPDERKAYLDGFEMCARCLKRYLTDEGKRKLESFIAVARIATKIDNVYDYIDLADTIDDIESEGLK